MFNFIEEFFIKIANKLMLMDIYFENIK